MGKLSIGLYGSAFNPPHLGHLDVLNQAANAFDLIYLIPSFNHAFGKQMAPFSQRMSMANALLQDIDSHEKFTVSDIELEIANKQMVKKPIFTFDVLTQLSIRHPHAEIKFIVGPDNADPKVWGQFYNADKIIEKWGLWEAQERRPIRSSLIRQRISQMLSVDDLVPAKIAQLIKQYQLYQNLGE